MKQSQYFRHNNYLTGHRVYSLRLIYKHEFVQHKHCFWNDFALNKINDAKNGKSERTQEPHNHTVNITYNFGIYLNYNYFLHFLAVLPDTQKEAPTTKKTADIETLVDAIFTYQIIVWPSMHSKLAKQRFSIFNFTRNTLDLLNVSAKTNERNRILGNELDLFGRL